MSEDIEPTAEERIENALIAATETSKSPAYAFNKVMSALGFDFGSPDETEHTIMQFYADPKSNPFIQAAIESRLLIDVGVVEKLVRLGHYQAAREFSDDEVDELIDGFMRAVLLVDAIGVKRFNDRLSEASARLAEEVFSEAQEKLKKKNNIPC